MNRITIYASKLRVIGDVIFIAIFSGRKCLKFMIRIIIPTRRSEAETMVFSGRFMKLSEPKSFRVYIYLIRIIDIKRRTREFEKYVFHPGLSVLYFSK
jgi:hypothetical protein